MPFFTALFTAGVAIYVLSINRKPVCIVFGSFAAMLAIDMNNQIIFIIGCFFVNILAVVLKKITASLENEPENVTEREIRSKQSHFYWFLSAYIMMEVSIFALKGTIFLNKHSDRESR